MVSYVSHLSIESLFALISKIDQFGVLKAETHFYLQKSVHFALCGVDKYLPGREVN